MGDVYKGLTIRIGADTTGLTAALKEVNNAARNTQSALKRINKGLGNDPANISLLNAKLEKTVAKSAAVAVQMRIMREQLSQMKGSGLEKVLQETENLELRAASARQEYKNLVRQISEIRTEAATSWGWSQSAINDKSRKQEIDDTIAALARQDAGYKRMYDTLRGLQLRLKGATKEMELMSDAKSYQRLKDDFKLISSDAKVLAREAVEVREAMLEVGKTKGLRSVANDLKGIEATTEQVNAEFKTLDEALKLNPKSVETCVKRLTNLDEQAALTKKRIDALRAKISELEKAGAVRTSRSMAELAGDVQTASARVELLTEKLHNVDANIKLASDSANEFRKKFEYVNAEKAEESVKCLRAEAEKLKVQLNEAENAFDAAHATRELRKVENEITHANAQLKNFSTLSKTASGSMAGAFFSMRTAGYSLSATIGSAMSMVGYSVVSKAEDIDAAFRDMKKTVNGTDEQFAKLRADAIEYSKTHFTSADTLLEVEAMAGQLGVAANNLEEFATTVSNLDIATDMEAEDIAIDLGKLSNVLSDLDEGNVSNFADALVRLGNNNAALESDIMNITTRFGGLASQVGMSADEILAWGTAASATGVKAESAGSNMLKTIGLINGAVSTGGNKLELWSNVIGMSADQIKKKWGDNNGGTTEVFKSFIETLSSMKPTEIDAALVDLGITSVRQRQLIEGLTQSVGNMDDVLKMSSDAWHGVSDEWGNAGDAAYEAQQKSEGFSGAMALLRNNLAAIADQIGTDLVPYIYMATDALQEFSKWYGALSANDKDFFMKTAIGLAALGPSLVAVSALGSTITSVGKGVSWFGEKLTTINAKHLVKEVNKANGVVSTASGTFKTAASSSVKLGAAVEATGGTILGSMSKFSAIAGVTTLLVIALAAIAKSVYDARQEFEEFQDAIDPTNVEEALKSLYDFNDGAGDTAASIEELRKGTDSLVSSISKHNDAEKEQLSEVGANMRQLDSYAATVEKVSKKVQKGKITKFSDLSDDEQGKLQAALNAINEAMGTNYKPIDIIAKGQADEAKKVNDQIQRAIELKKVSAQQDAISSIYNDRYKEQLQAQEEYDKAQKTFAEKQRRMQELSATSIDYTGPEWNKAQAEYNEAKKALEQNEALLDACTLSTEKYQSALEFLGTAEAKGAGSIQALIAGNSTAFGTLAANDSLKGFASTLDAVGVKYKNLTNEQKTNTDWLAQLATQYDGTVASIVSGLSSIGVAYGETSAKTAVAKENIKSALDSMGGDAAARIKESYGSVGKFVKKLQQAGFEVDQLSNLSPIQWESILNVDSLGSSKSGISDELKSAISSAIDDEVKATVKVDADTSEADKKTAETKASVENLDKVKSEPKVGLDTTMFNSGLNHVLDSMASVNGKTSTLYLQVKKKGVATEVQGPPSPARSGSTYTTQARAAAYGARDTVAMLDDSFATNGYSVSDVSSGTDAMASRSRRSYRASTGGQTATLDDASKALLEAIARNTKGGKGVYLDGDKLVGGTAGRYDTTMARRERLAKRGLDI